MILNPYAFAAAGYDSDAQAFFTAAGISDTGQKDAINTLVLGLKSNSIWTKMKAIYPFVGGSASAHAVNLKSPGTYNITWSGGITHDSNGVQGNGSTGKGLTGLVPSSVMTLDSTHVSVYSRTNSSADQCECGAWGGAANYMGMFVKYTNGGGYLYMNSPDGTYPTPQIASGDNSSSAAFYVGSRMSSSSGDGVLYRNGVAGTTGAGSNSGKSLPTVELSLLAVKASGTYTQYSARQVAFISIGSGLTSTDASNLYTLVQAYQTALGRQV
jgi:hypothetical protein